VPLVAKGWSWLASHVPGMDPNANIFETLEQAIEKQAGFLAQRLGTILKNIASFVFDLFVMIFAMFYFFRDARKILPAVRSMMPFDPAHQEAMIVQIRDLSPPASPPVWWSRPFKELSAAWALRLWVCQRRFSGAWPWPSFPLCRSSAQA
jgi:hypothetical protein